MFYRSSASSAPGHSKGAPGHSKGVRVGTGRPASAALVTSSLTTNCTLPIARADVGSPCTACTDVRRPQPGHRRRRYPHRPRTRWRPRSGGRSPASGPRSGSSVHGPAAFLKRRAVPHTAASGPSQHPRIRGKVCCRKFSASVSGWAGSKGRSRLWTSRTASESISALARREFTGRCGEGFCRNERGEII
jgi:hypothetical protein